MRILLGVLKWLAIGFVALLVAVGIAALFMDWNWVKGYAARTISDQLGRELVIAGNLDVDLSLTPHIRAERILIENAAWGDHPQMAEIGALDLRLDILELLRGHTVILELRIDRPVLRLERPKSGRPNWQIEADPAAQEAVRVAAPEERTEFPVVEHLVVTRGRVAYLDHGADTDVTLGITKIEGTARDGDAGLEIDGAGRLEAQPWRLALRAGSFERLTATDAPYPLDAKVDLGQARTRIKGDLEQPMRLRGVDLDFSLAGRDLSFLSPFFPQAAPRLPPYDIGGRITRVKETWRLQDFRASVGVSRLRGEVTADTSSERPLVRGDLSSTYLDYQDFAGLTPPSAEDTEEPRPLDLSLLKSLDAVVALRGEEIHIRPLALRDLQALIRLQNGRLRVRPLSLSVGGGQLRAQAELNAGHHPFTASVRTDVQDLDLRRLGGSGKAGGLARGIINGHIGVSLAGAAESKPTDAGALAMIDRLTIENSRVSYEVPANDTRVRLSAATKKLDGRRRMQVLAEGRWQGEPFELTARLDPLLKLADPTRREPYAVEAHARGAGTIARIQGTLARPLALQGIDLAVALRGSGTDRLAAAIGRPLPNLPPYRLRGRLRKGETAAWTIRDLDGRVGGSDLAGTVSIDPEGERPYVKADLVSQRLDYADFTTVFGTEMDERKAQRPAAKPDTAGEAAEPPFSLKPLQQLDADVRFKGTDVIAPNVALRELTLDIELHDGRLRLEPLSLGLGGGVVRGTLEVDSAPPTRGSLDMIIEQVDVQKVLAPLKFDTTFGVLDGRARVSIVGATREQIADAAERTPLTFIHSLVIDDTLLHYRDADKGTDVEARIATGASTNGAEPIRVKAAGRYRGEAFELDLGAGSLLRLLEEQRPYPIHAKAEAARTKARLRGSITQPLALKGMDLSLWFKGPNPSALHKLLGVPLPDLPPYEIRGQLSRRDDTWRLGDFRGTVGDSDLAGDIQIDTLRDPRPLLQADLTSRRLDFDDLGGLIGEAPDTGRGDTESRPQAREAQVERKSTTVLPQDPIDLRALRDMDARVSFEGERVKTQLPIDKLRIIASLEDGRLTLKPLDFGIGGGDVKSRLRIDASARPVQARMQTEVSQVDLKRLLRQTGFADESLGHIGGRARLEGTGDSIADLMATLYGELFLAMKGGRLDSLLIELGGLDATQAIGDLLGDEEARPIRCAFTELGARNGQVDFRSFVIDTVDTRFTGDGSMDLDRERLRFTLVPHAKDFSIFAAPTPFHARGRFSDLGFYPDEELAERIAFSVVLGLVATPLAAIIPLIEPGTGENAACRALLESARKEARAPSGAPDAEPEEPPVPFITKPRP